MKSVILLPGRRVLWGSAMAAFLATSSLLLVSITDADAANPVPQVNQPLVPASIAPGGPAFTLTVNGTGFVSGSVVNWNDAAASTCKSIHVFTGTAGGANPFGNLTFDAAGNLYGTTVGGGSGCGYGCGVVWKLAPKPKGTWMISILHVFSSEEGGHPYAGLVFDAVGNLYGTAANYGVYGHGAVYKLNPNPDGTWTESVLHSFTGADGDSPYAGLVLDTTGNLYGTTTTGGSAGAGVVFELKPNPDGTWTESVLYGFKGDASGGYPGAAVLVFDAAGNLYGTTSGGGAYGYGVVFKLEPNPDGTWTENVLHSFTGTDGANPYAVPLFGADGNLYGTTNAGGASGAGAVFKLKPSADGTWTESVLYSFAGGADGATPYAGVIFDAAGNLYGTTVSGGVRGYGVVFKLTPTSSGWSETVVHSFGSTGRDPYAPVIFDRAGHLYGTTSSGTGNNGIVFEITP